MWTVSFRASQGERSGPNGEGPGDGGEIVGLEAGATDEEVLLRRRQLETSFTYFVSAGFTYRFGSIFNNIVNPRFGGAGGGEGFFF